MISQEEIVRARSVPLLKIAGRYTKLRPTGNWMMGCCCMHDDKTPSFGIRDNHWHCFAGCGHGDVIELVSRMERLDFPAAVHWLLNMPAQPPRAHSEQQPDYSQSPPNATELQKTADRVHAILAGCGPVTIGTAARLYLTSRGLSPDQPALLAHPALFCSEIGKPLPALVAPITNSAGEVCAVQRIWCAERVEFDGTDQWKDARAPLATRKKTLGHMGDGAVRLAPAGALLGLAEGVETAIAASMLYRLPVWAVCGAARLGRVWAPNQVGRILIVGDNGRAGRDLGNHAVAEWRQRGLEAMAVFPDVMFADFADQLIGRRSAA